MCSSCADAGAQCLSFDPATQQPVPRSVTQYLRERIATLESQAPAHATETAPSLPASVAAPSGPLPRAVAIALHDATSPSLGLTQRDCLAGCAPTPTQLPSSKDYSSNLRDEEDYPLSEPRTRVLTLASVPVDVAEFLFRTYVTRIIPQYPIFHETQVRDAFQAIFDKQSVGPIADATLHARYVYVVSLILAISLSTAARVKHKRAHALATGLFRNAMLQLSAVLTNDLPGLQALLLLIQYAFLDPTIANLWLLTGLSSEACIDMGLHRELPASRRLNVRQRDMRRRVFWCAWEMEVAASGAFHRPLRISRASIDVAFPSEFEDSAITETHIDSTILQPKAVSRQIWLFREIESRILSILYQKGPLPVGMTLETWMASVDQGIKNWRIDVLHAAHQHGGDALTNAQWEEMKLYANIASKWILVLLYRPCPRIIAPSRQNLTQGAIAAVQVANGYWEQQTTRFGYLKYVFHPCHHVFSSALVFLQALQHCQAKMANLFTLAEIEKQANSFPRFFMTIAERWPAARRCLEEYNRLLGPILEDFSNFAQRPDAPGWASALSDVRDGTLNDRADLSGSLNTWPFIHMPTSSTGVDNTDPSDPSDPSWSVPYDWNDEFAFGIEI